jgi:hypothetical protein
MAYDFTVAWQYSQREQIKHFLKKIVLRATWRDAIPRPINSTLCRRRRCHRPRRHGINQSFIYMPFKNRFYCFRGEIGELVAQKPGLK